MPKREDKKLYKSILIELLNSFSDKEKKRFNTFVNSDFFNVDLEIRRLLKALFKYVIGENAVSTAILLKIYQDTFKSTQQISSLNKTQKNAFDIKISQLLSLAKQFLVIEKLAYKPAIHSELLYEALLDKNQLNLCHRQIKKDRKKIDQLPSKEINYYRHAYQIENGYLNFLHKSGQLVKENNLGALVYNLDMIYLLLKLKLHITALSIARVSNILDYDLSSINLIEPLLSNTSFSKHPLLHTRQSAIQLMVDNNDETFFRLLDILEKNQSSISNTTIRDFYEVACNFCIYKVNTGDLVYNNHLYDLYKKMDDNLLLLEEGVIDVNVLKNIITLSCKLEEFQYAKKLLDKYLPYLNHKDEKSVFHFNLGVIASYQNDFKQAIHHFIRVEKVNLVYDINSRVLILKAYYLLDKFHDERTMTIFRTTEQFFIQNKKLKTNQQKGLKNFTRTLINLYKIRHKVGKVTKEKLIEKMNKLAFVSDKKWLLDKINEIPK